MEKWSHITGTEVINIRKLKSVSANIFEVVGILSILTLLGLAVLVITPLVILYGLFVGSLILWEWYGVRNNSSSSSKQNRLSRRS
jgi:hypothetical protein